MIIDDWFIKKISKLLSEDVIFGLLIEKLRKPSVDTELEGFEVYLSEKENIKFSWSLEISRNDKHL